MMHRHGPELSIDIANSMIVRMHTLPAVCAYPLLSDSDEAVNTLHGKHKTLHDADDTPRSLGRASPIPKPKGGHRYIVLCSHIHQDLGCLVSW